jgi:hypothetical protein
MDKQQWLTSGTADPTLTRPVVIHVTVAVMLAVDLDRGRHIATEWLR